MPSRRLSSSSAAAAVAHRRHLILLASVTTASFLLLLLLLALLLFFLYFYLSHCRPPTLPLSSPSPSPSPRLRRFSYRCLRSATASFDASRSLGRGASAAVFRGVLSDGKSVAVKRLLLPLSSSSDRDFHNELHVLAAIRPSPFVVSLLGYCLEGRHRRRRRLLVYEYMPHGSLQEALFASTSLLTWDRRFSIVLDVARALAFLHLECDPPVVHGDIKPSNVLLGFDFQAKISDFGLSRMKMEPDLGHDFFSQDLFQSQDLAQESPQVDFAHTLPSSSSIKLSSSNTPIQKEAAAAAAVTTPFPVQDETFSFEHSKELSASVDDGRTESTDPWDNHWWWKQDGSRELSSKDYVTEWIGSQICTSGNPPDKCFDFRNSSRVEVGDDALFTGAHTEKKHEKKKCVLHSDRKMREWWKEEYFAEISRKGHCKKDRQRWFRTISSLGEEYANRSRDMNVDVSFRKGCRKKRSRSAGSSEMFSCDLLSKELSSTTSIRGTVCYVAPECHHGCDQLMEKADVYSFGVLILVIVSGRRPLHVLPSPVKLEKANLVSWCRQLAQAGNLFDLVDERLKCKSLIERLSQPSPPPSPTSPNSSSSLPGPLRDGGATVYSLADSETFLNPFIAACSSGSPRVAEPALDCVHRLIAHSYLHGEADPHAGPDARLVAQLLESVCGCYSLGATEDAIELLVLKTLLSAVTSTALRIHGDSLLQIVRTCYDLYIGSKNPVNQTTAKASLIQMLVIVFRRMEADSSTVPVQPIVVAEMMEPADRSTAATSVDVNFVQGFITKIISDIDVVINQSAPLARTASANKHDGAFVSTTVEGTNPADLLDSTDKDMLDAKYWEISMYKTALEGRKDELGPEGDGLPDRDDDTEVQIGNKLRRDAFLVFRALCKLSMKTPPKEAVADPTLMKGKIVALELLKILLENAGAVFRTSERFLGAIKQYLCLSLLKNSASAHLIVFQLSCSIFISLVSRFRPGLKAEIGVFFPMVVLRVLENVAQPNFQQKMIVLRFMEKLCIDSQILVDIFLNYDCDVHSSNIFERIVNGLLKTAQGPPPGTPTTLVPPQDTMMKFEAMKCLVAILRSMGDWMNKQLRIPDPTSQKTETSDRSFQKLDAADAQFQKAESEDGNGVGNELPLANGSSVEPAEVSDSHPETTNGTSDVASIEQRRAYKLELQEGIALFNRKPKKGVEFLINAKKVGDSPEEIAVFLKSESGLNKTLIGDYLGEREDLSLKVMHAYVESFEFHGMEFDEAIRCFLQGFRLPGEAQKIDRIMEKFAEHYCKCNPKAFTSADTAYVLAYSIILLNTDAHNPMVKNKMSPDDFIRNNRGINDGKDLPEEYLRSLFERISKNEIKMKDDDLTPQQVQSSNSNKLLGLDSILNIVIRKRDSSTETSDDMIRQMQEQFKEKARKTESIYYSASNVVILRFMTEVCWAPMLAAFSVPLDQSDDETIIALCLEGFRSAVHVTSVMSMKTQRDAFVTSLAKFTSLHSAADMKQKNIDAIKAILCIADEDGNYLQEAWEHILTCVSRFEHLHLLGEGAPPDAAFFSVQQTEIDKSKQGKSSILPVLKKKGPPSSVMRRGTYDSAGVGGHAAGVVTSEQMNNLISNLNLLGQVGIAEVTHIFVGSERLDSEAIVDFVKALCKVSMEELRSTSEPRIFSLTKIVEIAHYNMNRIRLVWSNIWNVLSEFFVTIGCSENLSIAIFAMDSLRQLAMKFLERKELTNYNFQNEFMKPFVIVMRKSRAVEIRELIIRCVSQMVLARVSNVKSGWKSMFMVFATASYDDHKNIVLLAFEIIEKILRDYFPYITETETTTFTDCVNCLIAFTNSRFNKDISLNAIAFLRFCAAKLAEGDIGASAKSKNKEGSANSCPPSPHIVKEEKQDSPFLLEKDDDHLHLWFPLLAGLSELTFDLRAEIRQSSLQVLFDTLRNYGHHFSLPLWEKVFDSVLFPIFDSVRHAIDLSGETLQGQDTSELVQDAWLYETCKVALQLVVDLFVKFYDTVNPLLKKVLTLLTSFIKRPHQSLAGIGITAFVRLMGNAGSLFTETNWEIVVVSLKEAATATLPDFSYISSGDYLGNVASENGDSTGRQENDESRESMDDFEGLKARNLYFAIGDAKCRAAVQLLLIQAVMEIYNMYRAQISAKNTLILFEALHAVACHAHKVNSDSDLRSKLQDLGSMTQMQDPPLLRLENESYQLCLVFLQNIAVDRPPNGDLDVEPYLVDLCREILEVYLATANTKLGEASTSAAQPGIHWAIPVGSAKRRELAARGPIVVSALRAICGLGDTSFKKNLVQFFPLIAGLISCEHGSNEVQLELSHILSSSVGPILLCAR